MCTNRRQKRKTKWFQAGWYNFKSPLGVAKGGGLIFCSPIFEITNMKGRVVISFITKAFWLQKEEGKGKKQPTLSTCHEQTLYIHTSLKINLTWDIMIIPILQMRLGASKERQLFQRLIEIKWSPWVPMASMLLLRVWTWITGGLWALTPIKQPLLTYIKKNEV